MRGVVGLKNAERKVAGFKLVLSMERDQPIISKFLRREGRFILATNELDSDRLSSADILVEPIFRGYVAKSENFK